MARELWDINNYRIFYYRRGELVAGYAVIIVLIDKTSGRKKNQEELTETIEDIINKYSISPFKTCFVLYDAISDIYMILRFVKASLKFIDNRVIIKDLQYLVAKECRREELFLHLPVRMEEVECTWK